MIKDPKNALEQVDSLPYSIQLFQGLATPTLYRIKTCGHVSQYLPGIELLTAGDRISEIYFVLSGRVRLYRLSSDGREQILGDVISGEVFNLAPVFTKEGINPANARTIEKTLLFSINTHEFVRLAQKDLRLSQNIIHHLAERLVVFSELLEQFSLHSVRARLARYLINQANNPATQPRRTQDEIASRLGTVRDVIGRILKDFTSEGLIRRERNQIILLDRKQMEDTANQ
jgi:CRP/FNR family transcriptional regulator